MSGPSRRWIAVLAAGALACGSKAAPDKTPPPTTFGGDRPVTLAVPDGYDDSQAYPLLIMLHGYMASGYVEETFVLHMTVPAAARGVLYAYPDGTADKGGSRFWNDWPGSHDGSVDDSGYLAGLVAAIRAAYHVDDKRIFFMGHSNGGSMSYRMACDHADVLAGIAVLAGDMPTDAASICKPAAPVSLLNVHGTADLSVPYDGTAQNLGAKACTDFWANVAHCTGSATGAALDLDTAIAGAETTVSRRTGCAPGIGVELWSIAGAGHVPSFGTSFGQDATYSEKVLDFLLAHPKP